MIRTAIPFGYLFIALFLLAAFVFGVSVFIRGWRRGSRGGKWLGAAMVAIVLAVIAGEIVFEVAIEWNPTIGSDTEVLGTWADRAQIVTLQSDKTFTFRTSAQTTTGTWTRDDWNLYLHGDSYSGTMRFVQFRGHYRLMTKPPEDPDMWDGDLGLQRTQKK